MLANECSIDARTDRSNEIFYAKLNVDTNITYLHKLHVIWSIWFYKLFARRSEIFGDIELALNKRTNDGKFQCLIRIF
jgi:hypothetical protein